MKPRVIAIVGHIGAGKSTVAKAFSVLGVSVFNADQSGKKALKDDAIKKAIVHEFGVEILNYDDIDIPRLANIVFSSTLELKRLTDITHPFIAKEFTTFALNTLSNSVMIEAATFPSFIEVDKIIEVNAPIECRLKRVMARGGIGEDQFNKRELIQKLQNQQMPTPDYHIHNDGKIAILPSILRIYQTECNN